MESLINYHNNKIMLSGLTRFQICDKKMVSSFAAYCAYCLSTVHSTLYISCAMRMRVAHGRASLPGVASGQLSVAQNWTSCAWPSQFPPPGSARRATDRVRVRVPPPQVLEQADQGPYAPHSQERGQGDPVHVLHAGEVSYTNSDR